MAKYVTMELQSPPSDHQYVPNPPALRRTRSLKRISTSQGSFDALVENKEEQWTNEHLALLLVEVKTELANMKTGLKAAKAALNQKDNEFRDYANSGNSSMMACIILAFVLLIIVLESLDLGLEIQDRQG